MVKAQTKNKAVTVKMSDAEKEELELEKAFLQVEDAKENLAPDKLPSRMKKEMYEMWLSIPAMLRLLPDRDLEKMGYEISNPVFMMLLKIESKRQFAKTFGLGVNTPQFWESKEPEMITRATEMARRQHALRYQKDVDFSFTQKVLKNGDAPRVKLWYQVMTGWSEKIETKNTNLNVDVVSLVQAIEKRNSEIRGS